MSTARDAALAFARAQQPRFLDQYQEFLTIPSVSTDPAYAADVQRGLR